MKVSALARHWKRLWSRYQTRISREEASLAAEQQSKPLGLGAVDGRDAFKARFGCLREPVAVARAQAISAQILSG